MTEVVRGEFVCVVCPNGCAVEAEFVKGGPEGPPRLLSAEGYRCPRGERWIRQEIEEPMRTVSTSVLVGGGDYVCASVRTKNPIPLDKIPEAMDAVRGVVLEAPVHIGDIAVSRPAGTDTDFIVTRNVERVSSV